jgi:hypothetical protein
MFICIRGIDFDLSFYDFRLNFETVLICFFVFRHDILLEDNYLLINLRYITYANMTSTLRFVDTRAIYRWYNLIRKCAGECDWLFRRECTCWWIIVCSNLAALILCDIFRKRKYKLPSSNQSILPYLYT